VVAGALLAVLTVPLFGSAASGEESVSDVRARMESIQAELNAAQAKIEDLRTQNDVLNHRIEETRARMDTVSAKRDQLMDEAVKRARKLYMSGGTSSMVEVLFGSEDMSEALSRSEILSRVSMDDASVFVHLSRSRAELERLNEDLEGQSEQLEGVTEALAAENAELQQRFDDVAAEYERLKRELLASVPVSPSAPPPPPESRDLLLSSTDGMYCPVAGPTSFVDSWGAPRAGHTHQGVDMMGSYGTPLVAVTGGTITYAAYDGSGGNMIFLSGDDGNAYWYMHNQSNLVTGGHVSAGQQIATLGDTGNAAGTPHLHFEYHPGGGAAVNPYPLVAGLC
jgi:murein DD-endopeptidase MepM/ murein hydrolase activator NlpD